MNKQRWVEGLKSLLILLLAVSAVCLLIMTPLVQDSGLADLFSGGIREHGAAEEVELTSAAHPSRMAVMGLSGRYGIQYSQKAVDELFLRFGSLLGEALISAEKAEEITESRWRECLSGAGVYFDFDSVIPLSALGSWLQSGGECGLQGSARRLLLAEGGEDQVILCYQDGQNGGFYACGTRLSSSLHLRPMVESVEGNSATFAYENVKMTGLLQPYTLMTEDSGRTIYGAGNPLEEKTADETADMLDFGKNDHVPISGGEAYLAGTARLEIRDSGTVTYSDGHEGRFPVAAVGNEPTVAEIIEAARLLADRTVGALCGEAQLYLESILQTEEGYRVRFGYRINGSAVWLYEEGWAAQFAVREGYIREFTLHFRSYAPTSETTLLLPIDRAAVILPQLTEDTSELVIRYRDRGSYLVPPGWIAR